MAIRTIREIGDPILNKVCKEVKSVNERTRTLIDDMFETMWDANGCGLAAPQVGILKRICVVDVGEEPGEECYVLINPRLIEADGEQRGYEGCLSVPDKSGVVTRPNHVKVVAYNEDMEEYEIEGTGLLARALVHEMDHLDGKMYTELAEDGKIYDNEELVRMNKEGTAPIPLETRGGSEEDEADKTDEAGEGASAGDEAGETDEPDAEASAGDGAGEDASAGDEPGAEGNTGEASGEDKN